MRRTIKVRPLEPPLWRACNAMSMSCETDYAACPIFRNLSPAERQAVLRIAHFQTHAHGHTILHQGELAPSGLWMVRSGTCEVVADVAHGGERQMAFLAPGSVFGELSFFDDAPHSATVRVVEDSELMHLPLGEFGQLEESNPQAAYKLLQNLGRVMAQNFGGWTVRFSTSLSRQVSRTATEPRRAPLDLC